MKRQPYTRLAAYMGVADEELGEKTVCVIAPKEKSEIKDEALCKEREKEVRRVMEKNGIPVDQLLFREDIPMDLRHRSKVEYAVSARSAPEGGARLMTAQSKEEYGFFGKWWQFAKERFDPLSHSLMITLFIVAHYVVVAVDLGKKFQRILAEQGLGVILPWPLASVHSSSNCASMTR